MNIASLSLKNWMNFRDLTDVPLHTRNYVIGANAVGKSNFLDVFRFLRDVAAPAGARPTAGGLQDAITRRDGISKLRCLHGRGDTEVMLDVTVQDGEDRWRYVLGFKGEGRANNRVLIRQEAVYKNGEPLKVCQRPDEKDKEDADRLTATYLQNPNDNKEFRRLAHYFSTITYLHLVPQLLKFGDEIGGNRLTRDPFGQGFLQRIAETPGKTQGARLRRIQTALSHVVPEFDQLTFEQDTVTGAPHLKVNFKHWRQKGAWQQEKQFSDGTLRLIGLLWSLMEGDSLLLLEEPELSLNEEIVRRLPQLIRHVLKSGKYPDRQVVITTHSEALLSDQSIGAEAVIRLVSTAEGAVLKPADEKERFMLKSGFSVGQALLPAVKPALQPEFDFGGG